MSAHRGAAALAGAALAVAAGVGFAPPAQAAYEVPTDEQMVEELDAAIAVTHDYWSRHTAESLGVPYTPPATAFGHNGVPGVFDARQDVLVCDDTELALDNAYYCGGEGNHWIAIDLTFLRMAHSVGGSFVHVVVAHEWGHAIQAHLPPGAEWVAYEMQADCFAGAALQGAHADGTLAADVAGAPEVYSGYLAISTTAWGEGGSHGSAEERYGAFRKGATGGPRACLPV
jgi:hypothetical protein